MDLKDYLAEKRSLVDEALKNIMPEAKGVSAKLIRAMNYSLFAGGKRLRPILCIASAEAVGGSGKDTLPVACALEMIHTYSLIHDDLPSMDNDDMRRGKPTSHKVFGEALAVLAGDGLLTEAFTRLSDPDLFEKIGAEKLRKVINLIAGAAGYRGMVGGQAADMEMEGNEINHHLVEFIHTHKTGALIAASVSSGAILGDGSEKQIAAITSYGKKIGLAFQVSDDILDIEGDSLEMGKPAGSDLEKSKNTYPSVHGLERSREILGELVDAAIVSLKDFDIKADPLRQIAKYITERKN